MALAITIQPTYTYKIAGKDVKVYVEPYWDFSTSAEELAKWKYIKFEWYENNRMWCFGRVKIATGVGKGWRKHLRHVIEGYIKEKP